MSTMHQSPRTLKPLSAGAKNIDHLAAVQCSAANLWSEDLCGSHVTQTSNPRCLCRLVPVPWHQHIPKTVYCKYNNATLTAWGTSWPGLIFQLKFKNWSSTRMNEKFQEALSWLTWPIKDLAPGWLWITLTHISTTWYLLSSPQLSFWISGGSADVTGNVSEVTNARHSNKNKESQGDCVFYFWWVFV